MTRPLRSLSPSSLLPLLAMALLAGGPTPARAGGDQRMLQAIALEIDQGDPQEQEFAINFIGMLGGAIASEEGIGALVGMQESGVAVAIDRAADKGSAAARRVQVRFDRILIGNTATAFRSMAPSATDVPLEIPLKRGETQRVVLGFSGMGSIVLVSDCDAELLRNPEGMLGRGKPFERVGLGPREWEWPTDKASSPHEFDFALSAGRRCRDGEQNVRVRWLPQADPLQNDMQDNATITRPGRYRLEVPEDGISQLKLRLPAGVYALHAFDDRGINVHDAERMVDENDDGSVSWQGFSAGTRNFVLDWAGRTSAVDVEVRRHAGRVLEAGRPADLSQANAMPIHFTFTAQAAGAYRIRTSDLGEDTDTILKVHDSRTGVLRMVSDDTGADRHSDLTIRLRTGEEVFVELSSFGSRLDARVTASYLGDVPVDDAEGVDE